LKERRSRAERAPAPDVSAAVESALRYLGTRPRTRWEVERRLQRAGCTDDTIAESLARLTELGYIDDAAFVRWWSEQRDRHAPRGRRLIDLELRQRGISRDLADALLDAPSQRRPEDAALPQTDEQRAAVALERHLRGRRLPDDPKALQRLGMFLMRRGFGPETVRATIRAAGAAADDGRHESGE
jgi:regulatory protein